MTRFVLKVPRPLLQGGLGLGIYRPPDEIRLIISSEL
jgi:hypothetical protein